MKRKITGASVSKISGMTLNNLVTHDLTPEGPRDPKLRKASASTVMLFLTKSYETAHT